MDFHAKNDQSRSMRIGIIGGGFSGTAVAATLERLSSAPLDITLFEKNTNVGLGHAYSTPFPCHLLNVRAKDMSAFADDPAHFVNWLQTNPELHSYLMPHQPIAEQFVPRMLYGKYLQHLLGQTKANIQHQEVVDLLSTQDHYTLVLKNGQRQDVDKIVFALGNNAPASFPFPISGDIERIDNPWDYSAPLHIDKQAPVLIVGTGLSMIDAVLTLHHHEHQGKIYVLSRHGLIPLPHTENQHKLDFNVEHLPTKLDQLNKYFRLHTKTHMQNGGDWRSVMNGIRPHIGYLWNHFNLQDKKKFIRHVLPYWNVHRHRVHDELNDLLKDLSLKKQLSILAGRVLAIENGKAKIKLRHSQHHIEHEVKCVINCMGPLMTLNKTVQPLVRSLLDRHMVVLDPLHLGFSISNTGALKEVSGKDSSTLFALGPLTKGMSWESTAVPDIRLQSFELAKQLLTKKFLRSENESISDQSAFECDGCNS